MPPSSGNAKKAIEKVARDQPAISFHQINKNTGHRIKYQKVDAESGDEVEPADIIKGYQVGKGPKASIYRSNRRSLRRSR